MALCLSVLYMYLMRTNPSSYIIIPNNFYIDLILSSLHSNVSIVPEMSFIAVLFSIHDLTKDHSAFGHHTFLGGHISLIFFNLEQFPFLSFKKYDNFIHIYRGVYIFIYILKYLITY